MADERILIVDDEVVIQELLSSFLGEKGYSASVAGSAEEAIMLLADTDFDIVLCDIRLPGRDGLLLLNEIKHITPDTEVVMITGHASMESSIDAVGMGAYDYLLKPFDDLEEVLFTVERAVERRCLSLANKKLLREYERQNRDLTDSVQMLHLFLNAVHSLNSISSIPELLGSLADLTAKTLSVDQSSIMLIDEDSRTLRIAAAHGLSDDEKNSTVIPLGVGVTGKVAETGKPFLRQTRSADVEANPGGQNSVLVRPFPVSLSVPIMKENRVVGTLNVPDRPTGEIFTAQDLDFMMGIADLAGIALRG